MITQYTKQQMLLMLALLPLAITAQTVNTGTLHIAPNTEFSTVQTFNNHNGASVINDGEAFIYSHFINNGSVDFTPGLQGLTRFTGTAVQELSGGNISYFYDVEFNNPASNTASFELSSEISITNNANFSQGIVKNDDFGGTFTFEPGANHTGAFDGSHVDGHVQKFGDNSFTYPIGDAQYFRYAAISAPDNNTDLFTAKYFFENPVGQTINGETPTASTTGVITLLDTNEYWTITRDIGNSQVLLTLSWEEGTTTLPEVAANPQTAIHIVRWDEAQQLWVDEGGIVDADNKTVTTPLSLDAYGIFTLARVNESLLLPGDVVVYNGITPNGDGVNDYFIIDNIQNLANNTVEIFNRWGVKVFGTSNYDTNGNVFNGFSDGRITVSGDNLLPTGTYYYVLSYDYTSGGSTERIKQAGYLYLTAE